MTDYILLKLTESALRAVRAPKGPTWVYKSNYLGRATQYYDAHPTKVLDHGHVIELFFPAGTSIMRNNKVDKAIVNLWMLCDTHGPI